MFSEKQGNVLHGILLIVLFFILSLLHCRIPVYKKSITQPPHCRHHTGYALRQQPA